VSSCYDHFKTNYSGSLRERIITTLLYDNKSKTEDISYCLKTALDYISNEDFRRLLQNIKNNLITGSVAYEFKLPDENGMFRDYSDFRGKVVLLDFWFTGCTGCLLIKPKMDSIINLFKNKQIVFISISIDKDKDRWISSLRKNIYTSEHSVNLYTDGKGDMHPIIAHYLITAYPTLILVDKDGKLCEHPINPRIDNGTNLVDLINRALGF
jgi:thiol-disulfide isomerase/thioredoxin